MRKFYQNFPNLLEQNYRTIVRGYDDPAAFENESPRVWKTQGDEILFCCKVISLKHLSSCIEAFLRALRAFGTTLDQDRYLDVKGAGWVAAFPAPNVTVAIDEIATPAEQFDEEFECRADRNPRSVDFLGNSIDCGFRLAGQSAVDRFVLSAELAWLLAEAGFRKLFTQPLWYLDRHVLKGVIKDRPYPIVFIETERSPARSQMRVQERRLLNQRTADQPDTIREFLHHFMVDEGIEFPFLPNEGNPIPAGPPKSYQSYKEKWLSVANDVERLARMETESELPEHDGAGALPPIVFEQAEVVIDRSQKPAISSGS